MRLDRIELQNYRCYKEIQVDFQPGFNVIAGVNGSGKTSLLLGIREGLNSVIYGSSPSYFNPLANDQNTARIETVVNNGRYRFEPQFPVMVRVTGSALDQPYERAVEKSGSIQNFRVSGDDPGQLIWQQSQPDLPNTLPIIAFYPAYRHWPSAVLHEMEAATKRSSRADGHHQWWDASADSSGLQQWTIAKSMERLQLASDGKVGWEDVNSDELALVNHALAAVINEAKGLRYDFSRKSLLIEWSNNNPPAEFQNLSDGQRVIISLVADIARRMCLLNPHLGFDVTQKTPGIVLIDELDIHLHPKWQRLITRGLMAAFPCVQFIAASHSPQVLGELQPDQIILLQGEGPVHPNVSYGLDSSRVLEQIMDADARPAKVAEDLSTLFRSIEQNDFDSSRALLNELKKSAPEIPELAGAEALLKRKEVLNK